MARRAGGSWHERWQAQRARARARSTSPRVRRFNAVTAVIAVLALVALIVVGSVRANIGDWHAAHGEGAPGVLVVDETRWDKAAGWSGLGTFTGDDGTTHASDVRISRDVRTGDRIHGRWLGGGKEFYPDGYRFRPFRPFRLPLALIALALAADLVGRLWRRRRRRRARR